MAPQPAMANAPASDSIVEESLAVIEITPAALISSAPGVGSTSSMSAIVATTVGRTQLSATEPAPAKSSAPPPETAMAAICEFWAGGRPVGLANFASTVMPPIAERSGVPVTVAVTSSRMSL